MSSAEQKLSKSLYTEHPYGEFGIDRMSTNDYLVDFMEGIPDKASKTLYDIGCGQGIWSEFAVESGFPKDQVVCFDQSPSALSLVREKGFQTFEGDAQKMPFADDVADVAMSIGVIHIIPSPESAFAEICRITKPGGLILIAVYNVWHPYFLFAYKLTAPLRYLYRKGWKSIITVMTLLLYPIVQLMTFLITRQFLKSFETVKMQVVDQIFPPYLELYSAAKLRGYGERRGLPVLEEGTILSGFMRYAVFRNP